MTEPTPHPGPPIALLSVHIDPRRGATIIGPGLEVTAATIPGALRHLASTLDGKPMQPALVGPVLMALPDGTIPLEAVLSVKCLNDQGGVSYFERCSPGLTLVEALGMLTTMADTVRSRLTGLVR